MKGCIGLDTNVLARYYVDDAADAGDGVVDFVGGLVCVFAQGQRDEVLV